MILLSVDDVVYADLSDGVACLTDRTNAPDSDRLSKTQ